MMTSKFRQHQKVQKWNESLLRVPDEYREKVESLKSTPKGVAFADALFKYVESKSIFIRIELLKTVVNVLHDAQSLEEKEFCNFLDVFGELIFIEHAKQLHKQMLSGLRELNSDKTDCLNKTMTAIVARRLEIWQQHSQCMEIKTQIPGQLSLIMVTTSLLHFPLAESWLRPSCAELCCHICIRIRSMLETSGRGCQMLQSNMEDAQEGVSALYALLQKYGECMTDRNGEDDRKAIVLAGKTMLWILQGDSLVREALASAAVSLLSAMHLPFMDGHRQSCLIMHGLNLLSGTKDRDCPTPAESSDSALTFLEKDLEESGSDLITEMRKFSRISRVCAIRGFVSAMPASSLCAQVSVNQMNNEKKVCLLPLALRALCLELDKTPDAHLRFHILSSIVFCLTKFKEVLQQVAPSIQTHNGNDADAEVDDSQMDNDLAFLALGIESDDDQNDDENDQPNGKVHSGTPEIMPPILNAGDLELLLGMLWRHLEDPLSQTEKQVYAAFELVLDVLGLQANCQPESEVTPSSSDVIKAITQKLLDLGHGKKGKYAPLSALIPRIGGLALLDHMPDLIDQLLEAFNEPAVSRAASQCLQILLGQLKSELLSQSNGSDGLSKWRLTWKKPVLGILTSDSDSLRSTLATYVLPVIVELDEMSLLSLVNWILYPEDSDQDGGPLSFGQLSALIAVLRVGRQKHLIPSLDAIVDNPVSVVNVPASALTAAISHSSDTLQMNALELACVHPKPTELPDQIDFDLVMHALRIGGRSIGQSIRNKFVVTVSKFLRRIHSAVKAALVGNTLRSRENRCGRSKDRSKSVSMLFSMIASASSSGLTDDDSDEQEIHQIRQCEVFMHAFSRMVSGNLYPGAPYARKCLAMALLGEMLTLWEGENWIVEPLKGSCQKAVNQQCRFQPFCPGLDGPGTVEVLVGATVDAWDHLRAGAVDCLMKFASPLPGIDSPENLQHLLQWSLQLVKSPRLRESDAGARLILLIFKKYICELNWSVSVHPNLSVCERGQHASAFDACMFFLRSLCSQLQSSITAGEDDLLGQCHHSLAHGVLLTLRYIIEGTDWVDFARTKEQAVAVSQFLDCLLKELHRGARLCLTILASHDTNVGAEDLELDDQMEGGTVDEDDDARGLGPSARLLITGTWLTMKEISVLMGSMARVIPLEGRDGTSGLLNVPHIESMGRHFLTALVQMKHSGAIEKSGAGFQDLCEALLRCSDRALRELPSKWMDEFLETVKENGQTRDSIVRRSAGLPFGFAAIFKAEPQSIPKVLLPRGLKMLLDISTDTTIVEPWPRVHALNSLRHAFNDKALATDASVHFAEGVCVCVGGLSDDVWEVRNAAALCFTALTVRMVGYKNVAASGSIRKSISAFEFFARYPSLHPFLQQQLRDAACQLESAPSSVPPCLAPVLLLLARLMPGAIPASLNGSGRSPSDLIPVVQSVVGTAHMMVRQLAARALVPLINKADLMAFLMETVRKLPKAMPITDTNAVHGNLLVLNRLLQANAVSLPSILNPAFIQEVKDRLFLVNELKTSAGVRKEFVALLAVIFESLKEGPIELKELERGVQHELHKVQGFDFGVDRDFDPMETLWLKECTQLCHGPVGLMGINDNLNDFEMSLKSPAYEVRVASLKALMKTESSTLKDADACHALYDSLIDSLNTEKHPKVVRRILEVLSALYTRNSSDRFTEQPLKLWETFTSIFESCHPVNIRRNVLKCMGHASRRCVQQSGGLEAISGIIGKFADVLWQCSRATSTLDLRMASVDAIDASGFLAMSDLKVGGDILSIWECALDLMEDEDPAVREKAGNAIWRMLQNGRRAASSGEIEQGDASKEYALGHGVHVEIVLREAIKMICARFGGQTELYKMLLGWLVDPVDMNMSDSNAASAPMAPGNTRKLFDKELDNHHEEPLLRAQLAAQELCKHASDVTQCIGHDYLSKLADGLALHLRALFANLAEEHDETAWFGGPTNHPDFFVPLYKGILAVWCTGKLGIDAGSLGELLEWMTETLHKVTLHPILGNLLLKAIEDKSGESEMVRDWLGGRLDTEFDPLFLVRM